MCTKGFDWRGTTHHVTIPQTVTLAFLWCYSESSNSVTIVTIPQMVNLAFCHGTLSLIKSFCDVTVMLFWTISIFVLQLLPLPNKGSPPPNLWYYFQVIMLQLVLCWEFIFFNPLFLYFPSLWPVSCEYFSVFCEQDYEFCVAIYVVSSCSKRKRWASLVYFDEKRYREVTVTIHQCSWSNHKMLTTHRDHQLSRMIMLCWNINDV